MNPLVILMEGSQVKSARSFNDHPSANDYMGTIPGSKIIHAESQLSMMSGAQLVAIYNLLSNQDLKKFPDKASAVSAVTKASFMSDKPQTNDNDAEVGAANEPLDENKGNTVPGLDTGDVVGTEQGGVDITGGTETTSDLTAGQAIAQAEGDLAFQEDDASRIQAIRENAGEISAQNTSGAASNADLADAMSAAGAPKKGGKGRAIKAKKEPKAPKEPKPKAEKVAAPPKLRDRGINLTPKLPIRPARAGSKQSILIDALAKGTTLRELSHLLSRTGTPWTDASIKTGFNWDVNNQRGYGVTTEFTSDAEAMEKYDTVLAAQMRTEAAAGAPVARAIYFLVLPSDMTEPLPHTTPKAAAPKEAKAAEDATAKAVEGADQQELPAANDIVQEVGEDGVARV